MQITFEKCMFAERVRFDANKWLLETGNVLICGVIEIYFFDHLTGVVEESPVSDFFTHFVLSFQS